MKTAFYKANAHTIIGNIRQRSNSKSIHLYHPLLYLQENMSLLESIAESLSFIFFGLKKLIQHVFLLIIFMIFHNYHSNF